MSQAETFLRGEGDNWHERNKDAQPNYIVLGSMFGLGKTPTSILEVGCGDGRYLGRLQRHYGAKATGIDPSAKAIEKGSQDYPDITFIREDAVVGLSWQNIAEQKFDLIFFGFCLYLIDRDDLMYIVSLADTLLVYDGYLAIYDFDVRMPHKVPYKHKDGIFTYKMDYPGLWLANPEYRLVSKTYTDSEQAITILKKEKW